LEKSEAQRKQSDTEALKFRSELDDIRAHGKSSDTAMAQVRQEAEQRLARLNELTQQVRMLTSARDAAERRAIEFEQEATRIKMTAEQALGQERGTLGDHVQRLTSELVLVKKQRADALAAAQQSKAEADHIKRLAAEKIRSLQASRDSLPPRTGTPLPSSLGIRKPSSAPPVPAPPPIDTLPPQQTYTNMHMPISGTTTAGGPAPVALSMNTTPSATAVDIGDAEKTVLVDVSVPTLARGDKP